MVLPYFKVFDINKDLDRVSMGVTVCISTNQLM